MEVRGVVKVGPMVHKKRCAGSGGRYYASQRQAGGGPGQAVSASAHISPGSWSIRVLSRQRLTPIRLA